MENRNLYKGKEIAPRAKCFKCGKEGHLVRKCPWKRGQDSWLTVRAQRRQNALQRGHAPESRTDKYWILLRERKGEIIQAATYLYHVLPGGRGPIAGDAPQVDPEHPEHGAIAWFDCVRHGCRNQQHQAKKVHYRVIPCSEEPVRRVHEWGSDDEWGIAVERSERTLMTHIRIWATSPDNCLSPYARLEDCPTADCHAHMYAKLRQWHEARGRRRRNRQAMSNKGFQRKTAGH